MKVIHIVHGKANPEGHNGISRVVYHLNKQEKLKGCDSQIWAIVDRVKSRYSHRRDEFVSVECFPRVRLPWGSHQIIDALLEQKDQIDIVHFHLIWFYDKNIIAKALKNAGIPFIITTHGTYSKPHANTGKRRLAKWFYERKFLNLATEIHTITREEGTGLQSYGYHGRSFVAYNGIDLDEVPLTRSLIYYSVKSYKNKIKLVWVGVLRDDKNLKSLIQAISTLPPSIRKTFVCILIGPDYQGNANKLLSYSEKLGCRESFDYIGPLYGQEKYDAIESADAYVMPSLSEVFSLAMLDAMACGKPSLATSGCGYSYFIKEDFFVTCEPYSQDLARGIIELLESKANWDLMGGNARRMVEEEFNWPSIATQMIKNYSRIANQ